MRLTAANHLISAAFSQSVADLKSRSQIVSQEAVSGRYADMTKRLGGNIGEAMNSYKALTDINQQRTLLSIRDVRLGLTQSNLGRIQDRVTGIGTQMDAAIGRNDTAAQDLVAHDAREALSDVIYSLNARYGERQLFAGDETASQPFDGPDQLISDIRQIAQTAADAADFESQINTYFNDPAGGWLTSIYNGSPSSSEPDTVTANDPALVALISGLSVLALSESSEGLALLDQNPQLASAAAGRVTSGTIGVINLRADLGLAQERIESQRVLLDTEETILNSVFNEITARDGYEAATELKQIEASLETAYLITTRLANLSLTNFLR